MMKIFAFLCALLFSFSANAITYTRTLTFEGMEKYDEFAGIHYYRENVFYMQSATDIPENQNPIITTDALKLYKSYQPIELISLDINPISSSVGQYSNVLLTGINYLTQVTQVSFWMGDSPFTYLFDDSFDEVTQILIQVIDGNSSFSIDNLKIVSAVPLPTGLPLFAAGLGLIALFKIRRAKPA